MKRLNGWQRLWVVISALYLVLVAGVTVLLWPTAATTWHRDEFITLMPAELRAHVDAAYESEWKWKEAWKARVIPPGEAKKAAKSNTAIPPPGFILLSAPVHFPNGAVLDVHVAKEGEAEPDARVGPAYWVVVETATHAAQWTMGWRMALVWLVPCLTLYAVGWATAWVRRGFSGPSAGQPSR